MQAIELADYDGIDSLRVIEMETPRPAANEVLIEVRAAGVNFAELELTEGRYRIPKTPPFVMGFEAAGVIVEVGRDVNEVRVGDAVTSLVTSGGYAEYAIAPASAVIPVPLGVSFNQATTIPVQGLSAYCLLKYAALLKAGHSVLIQAAAGGVGLYLVQIAKALGAGKVIALASTKTKLDLVRSLGADVALDYSDPNWPQYVKEATQGRGVDIVLESASGDIGRKSFELAAPLGRIVMFGAKNIHDTLPASLIQQLIYNNQTLAALNLPSLPPSQVAKSVPQVLHLTEERRLLLFADHTFPLEQAREALRLLAGRSTIGKVVLVPGMVN